MFSKSKEVVNLVTAHSDLVITCVEQYEKSIQVIIDGCNIEDKKKYYTKIRKIESEADYVRRDIILKLFEGRMLVSSRKSIMRLIEGVDNIADIAEEIISDLYIQNIEGLFEYKKDIEDMNKIILKQLKLLVEAVKSLVTKYDLNKMLDQIKNIENYESKVDEFEHKIIRSIFKKDIELAHKIQLKELINNIGKMADVIEDLSDEIEIIMMARNV